MVQPANNPLRQGPLRDRLNEAQSFWTDHGLQEIVSKDDFILGVLGFRNTGETLRKIGENPEGRKDLAAILEDPPTDAVELVDLLKFLNYQQKRSFKTYQYSPTNEQAEKSKWDHLRSMTRAQLMILATCSLAATTQGWDQASMAGANIQWPQDFGLNITRLRDDPTTRSVMIFSWLMAAPFFSGALVAFFVTDPLVNEGKVGRRWAIVFAGIFSLVSVVAAAFTQDWKSFMACRILLGVGMGAKASIVPIYLSEIAPDQIRGMLAMSWQLFDTFGILIGSCANLAVYRHSRSHPNWRFMIALPFIPALMFLTLAIFCVESPRWLLKAGRVPDALRALIRLHDLPSPIVACGQLYLLFRQLKEEERVYIQQLEQEDSKRNWLSRRLLAWRKKKSGGRNDQDGIALTTRETSGLERRGRHSQSPLAGSSRPDPRQESLSTNSAIAAPDSQNPPSEEAILLKTNLRDRICLMLLVPRMRHAVYASVCVMAAQQACGINILAFMSTTMFGEIRGDREMSPANPHEREQSLKFSVYFGLTNFLCTWFAFPMIDSERMGRRFLLNISFPFMAIFLFIIGGSLNTANAETRTQLFTAFTILFTAVFSLEGPTAFVISAEVHALIVRELGMSHAVFWNFFLASLLSFLVPIMASSMNSWWFWVLFGGFNVIFWRASLVFVKATENETLEGLGRLYAEDPKEEFDKLIEVRFVKSIWGLMNGSESTR